MQAAFVLLCTSHVILRSRRIPMRLYQNVQDYSVLINGTPQILPASINFEKDLVEVPFVSGPGTTPAQVIGKGLAELLAPLADRFVGHMDTANHHHLFNVAITQAE